MMKTLSHKIIPLTIVFVFVFTPIGITALKKASASTANPSEPCVYGYGGTVTNAPCIGNAPLDNGKQIVTEDNNSPGFWDKVFQNVLAKLALITLKLASLLTGLGGVMLNGVIYHTIVNVSDNYNKITSINEAWRVIRDVANMAFIFVLLYAAIQTILGIGKDTQRLIVRIVVVAILINFSLFFTKVVIDISNVLALTFYDAMVPNATTGGFLDRGLSNAFMDSLNLQNLYNLGVDQTLTPGGLIGTGVMGTILLLVASFVFFAIALMFIIRYVILILVLILSPIAFIAFILPQAEKYRGQWTDALIGQAFFAPIYMMLTWVTLRVLHGITSTHVFGVASGNLANFDNPAATIAGNITGAQGFFATIINYIVVIVFLIASLVISKEWASKAPGGVGKLTSWAMGAAGGATLGLAGRFGRNTLGRAGQALGESERLKAVAAKGGVTGMAARLSLATGRKTGGASFDVRGAKAAGVLDAGNSQKGGFAQTLKDKRKKEKDFTDSLGPSDTLVTDAERNMEKAKATHGARSTEFLDARSEVDRLKGVDEKEAIKRIKDRERAADGTTVNDERAKAMIESEGRDSHIIKGLKDIRKDQRVESIEKSPTYKAAAALGSAGAKIADTRVAQAISQVAEVAATIMAQAGERANETITNATADQRGLRAIGRVTGGVVRSVANAPAATTGMIAEAIGSIPDMIRAKNRAAIAEIRKGKKPVKDQLEEILRDSGDLTTPPTPPPTPPTPPTP